MPRCPTHDAQSIGGIISTDMHGTGRSWGFVSVAIVRLKLVDGRGQIHQCAPEDDLFRAAIGGRGAAGIITEVAIQVVDRFNVAQKTSIGSLRRVEANLEKLLADNDHVSLYVFPFTDRCQINTWNRTDAPRSFLGPLREFLSISQDALVASWPGAAITYGRLLPRVSTLAHGIKRGTDLVCNDCAGYEQYYAAAKVILCEMDACPHLGKYCQRFTWRDMERLHADNFTRFREIVREHDPDSKFVNSFARRLLDAGT